MKKRGIPPAAHTSADVSFEWKTRQGERSSGFQRWSVSIGAGTDRHE